MKIIHIDVVDNYNLKTREGEILLLGQESGIYPPSRILSENPPVLLSSVVDGAEAFGLSPLADVDLLDVGRLLAIHHNLSIPESLPSVDDVLEHWRERSESSQDFLDAEVLRSGLISNWTETVLLHGDMHPFNIVKSRGGRLMLIDPHGLAGPPVYDVARVAAFQPSPLEAFELISAGYGKRPDNWQEWLRWACFQAQSDLKMFAPAQDYPRLSAPSVALYNTLAYG